MNYWQPSEKTRLKTLRYLDKELWLKNFFKFMKGGKSEFTNKRENISVDNCNLRGDRNTLGNVEKYSLDTPQSMEKTDGVIWRNLKQECNSAENFAPIESVKKPHANAYRGQK